ncbi:MAG: lipopolysaccharide assembly protein LapB [Sutterellaceae bacterium]|nr:lipopolysaccharide assembly protein LapB [Burkholderiaceae bacterium]MCX7900836.1 lipopolysaccharide assembly protein LapB [Burkholderiaceae bacterium]MDW8430814.1 lipopolysaccharide assembly protein LapB [Sutterellaceae bacterium]
MELDLWYLIGLPLLFAAGWWLRGFDARVRAAEQGAAPQALTRGLNLLLNEQPDKAIDAFIDVVKLDPETIELHYALGNLFRRRGEVERAVRIHTHLLSRTDLPAKERANALAELGQDYLKAGLLDRAEDAFTRLLQEPAHRLGALRALLRIYQMEREWVKAIECARRLEREAGETHQVAVAHFHCELAQAALNGGDLDAAKRYIDEALAVHRRSVRALVIAGEIARQRGATDDALRYWLRIESDAPEYLPLVAARLTELLDATGRRAEALNLLRRNLLDWPSIDLLEIAYQRVCAWEGTAAGEQLLREQLRRQPTLLGFEKLLAARSAAAQGDSELELLRMLIHAQVRKLARYRCSKCGFRAREFHWQCPGCTSWDSYPPRRLEELDNT